jgi:hypothetical protein
MPDEQPSEEGQTEDPSAALYDGVEEANQQQQELVDALTPSEGDYLPFDPSTIGSQSFDPRPSSTAPGEDPGSPGDAVGDTPVEALEFDPRWRDEFEGLLYLGALMKRFKWGGHQFVIRTLRVDEVFDVTLTSKPYMGSMSEIKAYQAAVAAACLVSVDGKPLPVPLTMSADDTELQNRFAFIIKSWFPVVLDVIYNQYLELEVKVNEVLAAMGKVSG